MKSNERVSGIGLFEETKKNGIKEKLEHDSEKIEEKAQIADIDLNSVHVKKIVGIVDLIPVVLYLDVEEEKDPIGVFGFYDMDNEIFVKLDGSSLDSSGFDSEWKRFLKERKIGDKR